MSHTRFALLAASSAACMIACAGGDDDKGGGVSVQAGFAGSMTAGMSATTAGSNDGGGRAGNSSVAAGGNAGNSDSSIAGQPTTGGAAAGANGFGGEEAGGAGGESDGGEPPITFDCSQLPALPAAFDVIENVASSEDFVFDARGRLLNFNTDSNDLMEFSLSDMRSRLVWPGPSDETFSGIGMLPNGDIVANASSTLLRFTANGGSEELANSLAYPNGLTVARSGLIYVAEQDAGRVVAVDPVTKDKRMVAENLGNANGLALSQDQQTLYVGTFGDNKVWKIDLAQDPPSAREFARDFGDAGEFDGVVADYCGNVYVTEYTVAKVWRISPNGETSLAANLGESAEATWIPNLHFGSGIGGWDPKTLYVMNLDMPRVFALKIGVPGTTQPHL